MIELKWWEPWEHRGIPCEVRRLKLADLLTLTRLAGPMARAGQKYVADHPEGAVVAEYEMELVSSLTATPENREAALALIGDNVRFARALTLDGVELTPRKLVELLEDWPFAVAAIHAMKRFASISAAEGNGSVSPSGSQPQSSETTDTGSAATSTASAAGIVH